MKNKIIIFIAGVFLLPAFVLAQHHGSFQKYWFIRDTDTLPYRMLLPAHYNPALEYPLVIFLHGSGGRGNNNGSQLNNGGTLFITDSIMLNYPAIVVFPQCAKRSSWNTMIMQKDTIKKKITLEFPKNLPPRKDLKLLMDLIADIEANYAIDTQRLYLGGLSMGGMGTYELVNRMPKTFAAAFVMCGAGDTDNAKNLKETAWWIFHGQKDSTIYVGYGESMASALKKAGAEVKITVYPQDGHNCWDDAFKEPGLFEWMFSQKLKK